METIVTTFGAVPVGQACEILSGPGVKHSQDLHIRFDDGTETRMGPTGHARIEVKRFDELPVGRWFFKQHEDTPWTKTAPDTARRFGRESLTIISASQLTTSAEHDIAFRRFETLRAGEVFERKHGESIEGSTLGRKIANNKARRIAGDPITLHYGSNEIVATSWTETQRHRGAWELQIGMPDNRLEQRWMPERDSAITLAQPHMTAAEVYAANGISTAGQRPPHAHRRRGVQWLCSDRNCIYPDDLNAVALTALPEHIRNIIECTPARPILKKHAPANSPPPGKTKQHQTKPLKRRIELE